MACATAPSQILVYQTLQNYKPFQIQSLACITFMSNDIDGSD